VGHTANVPAIITAVEAADAALGKMVQAIEEAGGIAIITADHGNAEINKDELTGEKHTAHTTNPVPVIITSHDFKINEGTLADLAPTILKLLNLPVPASMTGHSLLEG
ncbi:MAG: 2,3-bisphosphoglycerate-independent phosphoglycerate mutase, partial [Candidatus Pacebacteria bacterium]|nr:2,3-bisphosphoglycerate-independent phosphoglycerate mutase [Candidatus Paceibacterota bacterium]